MVVRIVMHNDIDNDLDQSPGSPSSETPADNQAPGPHPPGESSANQLSQEPCTGHQIETRPATEILGEADRKLEQRHLRFKAGREAKEERLREHHRMVQGMVDEWLADLPAEMRGRALVRVSLMNMARAQLALDAFLDRVVRGERIPIGEQESMRKLASDAQAFKGDLLSRWPRAEERAAVKPIPASVNAWLDSLCDRCYPVPSAECGCAALPKCESCGQVVQPKREPGTPPAPAPEVLSRDDLAIQERKPERITHDGNPKKED
jgi:hypothetical protein